VENANAIILRESLEEMNALVDQAVPGIFFPVFEGSIPKGTPFLEEYCGGVLSAEVST
jgi:hypothetical protein